MISIRLRFFLVIVSSKYVMQFFKNAKSTIWTFKYLKRLTLQGLPQPIFLLPIRKEIPTLTFTVWRENNLSFVVFLHTEQAKSWIALFSSRTYPNILNICCSNYSAWLRHSACNSTYISIWVMYVEKLNRYFTHTHGLIEYYYRYR